MRTLVVVPTLLTSEADVDELVGRLEVHYLANPDGDLRFALLTDWTDADREEVEGDRELLAPASEGCARLNARYGPAPQDGRPLLPPAPAPALERARRAVDGLGAQARQARTSSTGCCAAPPTRPPSSASDGGPPEVPARRALRDHARRRHAAAPRRGARLVGDDGAPAQPPALRSAKRPRRRGLRRPPAARHAGPAGSTGERLALPARLRPGPAGIDPYASAVSDVYQDLFGEGSYTGKGIYDVDAFEAALGRPRPRERAAQPRPLRGHLRARRARRPTSSCSRSSPAATRWRRRASTAGCAATGSSCRGSSASASRPTAACAARACPRSAAGRCSTTCAARCRRRSPFCSTLALAWTLPRRLALTWIGLRPGDRCSCRRSCRSSRGSSRAVAGSPSAAISRDLRRRRCDRASRRSRSRSCFLPHQAWIAADAIAQRSSGST